MNGSWEVERSPLAKHLVDCNANEDRPPVNMKPEQVECINVAPRVALPGAKDSRPTSSEADEQAAESEKDFRKVQFSIQD